MVAAASRAPLVGTTGPGSSASCSVRQAPSVVLRCRTSRHWSDELRIILAVVSVSTSFANTQNSCQSRSAYGLPYGLEWRTIFANCSNTAAPDAGRIPSPVSASAVSVSFSRSGWTTLSAESECVPPRNTLLGSGSTQRPSAVSTISPRSSPSLISAGMRAAVCIAALDALMA